MRSSQSLGQQRGRNQTSQKLQPVSKRTQKETTGAVFLCSQVCPIGKSYPLLAVGQRNRSSLSSRAIRSRWFGMLCSDRRCPFHHGQVGHAIPEKRPETAYRNRQEPHPEVSWDFYLVGMLLTCRPPTIVQRRIHTSG